MRPLLILDCDEVVLDFVHPLRRWLMQAHDLELRLDSYALAANIRRLSDGSPIAADEFPPLIEGFFRDGQAGQQPVPGVREMLAELADVAEVHIVTNVPPAHGEARRAVLRDHGIDVPLHANEGLKGPRVAALAAGRPGVFVDDLPHQHKSVAEHAGQLKRLHFVATPELRGFMQPTRHAHARIDDWPAATRWIHQQMKEGLPA